MLYSRNLDTSWNALCNMSAEMIILWRKTGQRKEVTSDVSVQVLELSRACKIYRDQSRGLQKVQRQTGVFKDKICISHICFGTRQFQALQRLSVNHSAQVCEQFATQGPFSSHM